MWHIQKIKVSAFNKGTGETLHKIGYLSLDKNILLGF